MLFELTCPACGCIQRATDSVFGRIIICPTCGGRFPVSRPEGTRTTAPPAAPERRANAGRSSWAYAMLGGAGTLILVGGIALAALVGRPGRTATREPATTAGGGAPMSTAQVVAKCEQSVALIRGRVSSGTGFLVRSDLVATNAHVIDDEFVSALEVRFPSAPAGRRGPLRAELLYEDPRRDLALLAVRSGLPALELARSYRFLKGEDVTVIGNPGLGEQVVLENAISRGVMSSRAVLDGQDFLQMSISINPGNSGGPILDPAARVIGVATLRSSKAESLGFGIPVEELNAALIRLDLQPDAARAATAARHRARAAFRMLAGAGALYAVGLRLRAGVLARVAVLGPGTDLLTTPAARAVDEALTERERRQLARLDDDLSAVRSDATLPDSARRGYDELAANYRAMKELYLHPVPPADAYAARADELRGRHLRLVNALRADLGFTVPREQLAMLESPLKDDLPPESQAQLLPGPGWPRLGPFGVCPPPLRVPGGMEPFKAAREAEARVREIQQQLREQMEERRRALRERLGP